jgi:hypothetical protein
MAQRIAAAACPVQECALRVRAPARPRRAPCRGALRVHAAKGKGFGGAKRAGAPRGEEEESARRLRRGGDAGADSSAAPLPPPPASAVPPVGTGSAAGAATAAASAVRPCTRRIAPHALSAHARRALTVLAGIGRRLPLLRRCPSRRAARC